MPVRAHSRRRRCAALVCAALMVVLQMAGADAQGPRPGSPPADRLVDVLVTFRSTPQPADEGIVRGLGGVVRHRYRLVPGMAARLPAQAIAALQANPRVALVEPDGQVFAISSELGNSWGVAHIGAGTVHQAHGVDGSAVTVAVIDSGIDYLHPDLRLNYAGGRNFVAGTLDPFDDNGHGTHVAGSLAAVRNGLGVVGVAPGARVMALKVLDASGSGSWSHVIAAVEYATEQGVRITNNSYGAASDPGSLVQAAFDQSAARGVLHIAAAGNTGTCQGTTESIGWPARYASVVAVAATDNANTRACFSSTGTTLELSAPGVSIMSTIPGGAYGAKNGTSMAAPHAAGVAALVVGVNPSLQATDVRQILRETAQPLGTATQYGRGLVNAVAAVTAAGSDSGPAEPGDGIVEPPPPDPGVASVTGISYAWSGGPQGNRHLAVTVRVVDGAGSPIAGASVTLTIVSNTNVRTQATGTTGTSGALTISWNNAPGSCYTTTVTRVAAGTRVWDSQTPANSGCR